ncbi:hypothetical protein ABZW49_10315 [Nonomuraea wenchangensis]
MATLMIRDPYGNEFPVDATARRYWEHREGYEILTDRETEPAADPAVEGETGMTAKPGVPSDLGVSVRNSPKFGKIEDK